MSKPTSHPVRSRLGSWAAGHSPASDPGPSLGVVALGLLCLGVALAGLGVFLFVALRRIGYPYDLEWMEGGMLCHALRLLQGQPIYAPPSVDFIPHLYTPLYPMVVAALGRVFGDVGYLLARGVSLGAFLGALAIGGHWAYVEGGSRVAALCALGLIAACFPSVGGFYDLARADSLQLFFTVAGAALAWYGRERHARMALAALLLVAGFFAKQTAAPLIVFAGVGVLLTRRAPVITFVLVGVASFAAAVYAQDRATSGWFWTYIFRLHQSHAFFTRRAFVETPLVLFRTLGAGLLLTVWAGLAHALGRRTERQGAGIAYLLWLGLGGLFASCLSFGTQWAHTNAYIPGVFFPALAIGAAAGRLLRRPAISPAQAGDDAPAPAPGARALRQALVYVLLLASLVPALLRVHPARHLPTAADRAAGDGVIARLRSAPGEVLIPFHPFYAHLAGKRTYLHRMGVWDVRGTVAGPVRGLAESLRERRFARIVFDEKVEQTWADWPGVLDTYRITERFAGPQAVEGAQTSPGLVLEPIPPPPEPVTPATPSATPPAAAVPIDHEIQ